MVDEPVRALGYEPPRIGYEPPRIEARAELSTPLIGRVSVVTSAVFRPSTGRPVVMTDARRGDATYEPPRIEARTELAPPLIGTAISVTPSAAFRPRDYEAPAIATRDDIDAPLVGVVSQVRSAVYRHVDDRKDRR